MAARIARSTSDGVMISSTLVFDSLKPATHAGAAVARAEAAPTAELELELVRSIEGLEKIEAEWNELFERAGRSIQVFQTFNWIWHWASHFMTPPADGASKAETELAVLTGRRQGRIAIIWPLVLQRSAGIKVLSWAGDPVGQYGDVLVAPGPDTAELLRASWSHIKSTLKPDVLNLRKVRADATITPLLTEIGAVTVCSTAAPYLDLRGVKDFSTYEQRYSAKARKNRRRLLRRLEERGPVSVEFLRTGADARDRARHAISLKRAWLKERGLVSPALMDERFARFFEDVAAAGDHDTTCRISALRSCGETAAIDIGFGCKGRLALHVIVYGLKFEKAGAGVLLFEKSIAAAIAEGYDTIDLLAPADSYKLDWADGAVDVHDFAVPVTTLGKLYSRVYLKLARQTLKSSLARLPLSVRRFFATGYATALILS